MGTYDDFARPEQVGTSPIQTLPQPEGDRLCPMGEAIPVSRQRLSHGPVLVRRVRFVARWIYWSVMHRSTLHASWVCATEDLWW